MNEKQQSSRPPQFGLAGLLIAVGVAGVALTAVRYLGGWSWLAGYVLLIVICGVPFAMRKIAKALGRNRHQLPETAGESKRTLLFIPLMLTALFLLWENLSPLRVSDPWSDSPFASAWTFDSRTAFGWPFSFVHVFDDPSPVNAPARFDPYGLVADVLVWLTMLALAAAPWWFWCLDNH